MARNITKLHSSISGSNSPCYAPWLSLGSRSDRLNLGETPSESDVLSVHRLLDRRRRTVAECSAVVVCDTTGLEGERVGTSRTVTLTSRSWRVDRLRVVDGRPSRCWSPRTENIEAYLQKVGRFLLLVLSYLRCVVTRFVAHIRPSVRCGFIMDGCDQLISVWLNVAMRVVGFKTNSFHYPTRNAAEYCFVRDPQNTV